ncbi:MAG: hypothetical protein RJA61_620 [Candidatus Parcubacteria bacterium]|jgi:hypothetical protein
MADDKKKDSGGGGAEVSQEDIIVAIVFFAVAGSIFIERFNAFLNSNSNIKGIPQNFYEWFLSIAPLLQLTSIVLSALFFVGIINFSRKIARIRREEKEKLYPGDETEADDDVVSHIVNKKWERVEQHINSKNSSDWRLAIIEADIMLEELLDTIGYKGEGIGDKLKGVEKSDFLTLDLAWEAHKVRNAIAHEGSNFDLNERDARKVIQMFEEVFREFKYI